MKTFKNINDTLATLGFMELSDTVDGMISDDYKERFKAEYYQLWIRYKGLTKMLEKWDMDILEFVPTCPRTTYDLQLKGMELYMDVLEARAKMEGIEL